MKRKRMVVALACGLMLLAACGGETGSAAGDHSHSADTEEHDQDDSAFGEPGDPGEADQTFEIVAQDAPFRFEPESVEVDVGDTVVFELVNEGEVEHELSILATPTRAATSGHEHGNDPNATPRVEPGGSEQVVWTFTEPGEYVYECHVDGHHLAGMRGTITVSG